jgi:hypothetical protein
VTLVLVSGYDGRMAGRTIALVSLLASLAVSCGAPQERLRYGVQSTKFWIDRTETHQLGTTGVYVTFRYGYWESGNGNAHPLLLADIENRGDEARCAAAYIQADMYSLNDWGNGEPYLLQPAQIQRQAAGIQAQGSVDWRTGQALRDPDDGECPAFRGVAEFFETAEEDDEDEYEEEEDEEDEYEEDEEEEYEDEEEEE